MPTSATLCKPSSELSDGGSSGSGDSESERPPRESEPESDRTSISGSESRASGGGRSLDLVSADLLAVRSRGGVLHRKAKDQSACGGDGKNGSPCSANVPGQAARWRKGTWLCIKRLGIINPVPAYTAGDGTAAAAAITGRRGGEATEVASAKSRMASSVWRSSSSSSSVVTSSSEACCDSGVPRGLGSSPSPWTVSFSIGKKYGVVIRSVCDA